MKNCLLFWLLAAFSLTFVSCHSSISQEEKIVAVFKSKNEVTNQSKNESMQEEAILGAGCFWCVEAAFNNLKGVINVKSGYTGGLKDNPTYEDVCTGMTGHAEVVKVTFDPSIISFDKLLAAFFTVHDPTQLNRQGNDVGSQYRSSIFPTNTTQAEKATFYINKLNEEKVFDNPVVTTVESLKKFYPAESYHDNYYVNNPNNPYCQYVVKPKLEKFQKVFKADLL